MKRILEIDAVDLARLSARRELAVARKEILRLQFAEIEREEQNVDKARTALLARLDLPTDGSVSVVTDEGGLLPRGTLVDAKTGRPLMEDSVPAAEPTAQTAG